MKSSGQHPVTPIFALSHEFVDAMAKLKPLMATFQGVPGHDGEWDDFSPTGTDAVIATFEDYRSRLHALPKPGDRWERLATLVMDDYIGQELERCLERDPLTDLNSIASTFQNMRMVFDSMDASSQEGWRNIILRLEGLRGACAGYIKTLESGRAAGAISPARQVRAVIEQARVNTSEASFLYTLPAALERTGTSDAALKKRLEDAIPHARSAFEDLAVYLEQKYLPAAPLQDGVGRERYIRHARRFLGMDIDPLETYAWGFEQVRSIHAAMQRVAAEILPGAPLPEVFHLLKTDPARCADSPETFLRMMHERQTQALNQLDGTHFDIPAPARALDIKLAPPGGPLGAYYVPPAEGFTRPGTVWYALGKAQEVPLYDQISTAYHEGFPGHHLQLGTQVALTDRLSRLHRLVDAFTGYAEGWALYTELLMHELGYYEKPDYVLGMLTAQMMRACRVVLDIGAHLDLAIPDDFFFHPGERWSFELGVEMLTDVAYLPADHAESEMTRYLGWPGQAIAYKVGERVILELREEERKRLGSAFNLRNFHARIVGSGPVGLKLLQDLMRESDLS